jgi:hypothetical protein
MAIQVTIGTSNKIKHRDLGRLGADRALTIELEATATTTADEIQRQIQHHYETVTQAVLHQLKALNTRTVETTPTTTAT